MRQSPYDSSASLIALPLHRTCVHTIRSPERGFLVINYSTQAMIRPRLLSMYYFLYFQKTIRQHQRVFLRAIVVW